MSPAPAERTPGNARRSTIETASIDRRASVPAAQAGAHRGQHIGDHTQIHSDEFCEAAGE